MDRPGSHPDGTLPHPARPPAAAENLDVDRRASTTDDPRQPHCGDHANFHPNCPTCKQAVANSQPYPVRPNKPATRSFGFTDDLNAENLRKLNPKWTNLYADDPDFSLSLSVLRFLRRLIWPF
jgi:hypothetical protein